MKRTLYKIKFGLEIFLLLFLSSNLNAQEIKNKSNNKLSKYLNLVAPKGTETFNLGDNIIIVWEYLNIDKIRVEFSNYPNIWEVIVPEVNTKQGTYLLKIDSNLQKSFRLRISDVDNPRIFDVTPYYLDVKSDEKSLAKQNQIELQMESIYPTLTIMPLGNSITRGVSGSYNKIGYRRKLYLSLFNNGLNVDFVGSKSNGIISDFDRDHEGHSGYHAKNPVDVNISIADNLLSWLSDLVKTPDIILLHVGTNDIIQMELYNENVNDLILDVNNILDIVDSFNTEILVVVAQIINRDDNLSTLIVNESDSTSKFNTKLVDLVTGRKMSGDKIMLVDQESALNYPADLVDGIHPNQTGYDKMAPIWFDGIIDALPKLNAKIFLEAAYEDIGTMNTLLNASSQIPGSQPFNKSPWNYAGTEQTDNIPPNVVDWVLVSLRTGTAESAETACRAGFLKTDGSIVDLDGSSPLAFVVDVGDYYVVVEHRNHLPVMSVIKVPFTP
jgi:lysophospholipase L1-like esterase